MQQLRAEIETIKSHIQALRTERATLTVSLAPPQETSPEALVEAYRNYARENIKLAAELKGIDDAIAALSTQLQEKQDKLKRSSLVVKRGIELEQLESAKNQAKVHAERVNELAGNLAEEIRALKSCADELSVAYWQVYYKPFITGFKTISVPHVRSDGEVWTIVNRIV